MKDVVTTDADLPLPLQQHPLFAHALARLGAPVRVIETDGPIVNTIDRNVPLIGRISMVSRGPVFASSYDLAARQECYVDLARNGVRIINAEHPDAPALSKAGYFQVLSPAHIAELDLGRPVGRCGKWRSALRGSARHGLQVTQARFEPREHQWLLDNDKAQQRRKRYRSWPHAFLLAMAAHDPDAIDVFTAVLAGRTIAAMLFIRHGAAVTYHIGWSGPKGREVFAHHAILTEAATHFAATGASMIDLGLVDTDCAPGLARFKISTGATIRPLGGTWVKRPTLPSPWPISRARPLVTNQHKGVP